MQNILNETVVAVVVGEVDVWSRKTFLNFVLNNRSFENKQEQASKNTKH